jgi:hypothetical protein
MTQNPNHDEDEFQPQEPADEKDWDIADAQPPANTGPENPPAVLPENETTQAALVSEEMNPSVFDSPGKLFTLVGIVGLFGVLAYAMVTWLLIPGILIAALVWYFKFSKQKEVDTWKFYFNSIEFRPAFSDDLIVIPCSEITAFQMRYTMPKRGIAGIIPGTRQMCFWVNHKTSYSFDEDDYANFDSMVEFFTSLMGTYGLEESPYRQ